MKNIAVFVVSILSLVSVALTQAGSDPILERQELMENMKDNGLKPMIGMSRGKMEFDAATVVAGLDLMKGVAEKAGDLFPEGSETGHDTEALPEIWTDRDGFNQKLADYGAAVDRAAAAPPQSVDELNTMLDDVLGTCKGCHDSYRVEHD